MVNDVPCYDTLYLWFLHTLSKKRPVNVWSGSCNQSNSNAQKLSRVQKKTLKENYVQADLDEDIDLKTKQKIKKNLYPQIPKMHPRKKRRPRLGTWEPKKLTD